jgi:predicted dehydrogenase
MGPLDSCIVLYYTAHLPALAELNKAKNSPKFELKAVYSRSQKSADSLAASAQETLGLSSPPTVYYDVASDGSDAPAQSALAALLGHKEIAGVIVVLPITLQPTIIRQALAAGKAVLSEKPIAPSVAEGAKLVAEYRSTYAPKGLVWVCYYVVSL